MCKRLKRVLNERKVRKQMLKLDDLTFDMEVKIQGTDFDRKRLIKEADVLAMKKALNAGMSVSAVASLWNVSYHAVKYNTDDTYKAVYNAKRYGPGTHDVGYKDFNNRVAYKRALVKAKLIKFTY